jgi:hypothetical protein
MDATTTPSSELSLPFRATWIELFDSPLVRHEKGALLEFKGNRLVITPDKGADGFGRKEADPGGECARGTANADVVGALIVEPSSPGEAYSAVVLEEYRLISVEPSAHSEELFRQYNAAWGGRSFMEMTYSALLDHSMAKGLNSKWGFEERVYRAAESLLSSMRSGRAAAGTLRVDARAKVGSGKSRRLVKIKDLVIVAPKKQQGVVAASVGATREVDWSHRWDVMGHWRKIAGIGKDRSGHYSMKGYTWVVPHVKGPEGKPCVAKARVVFAGAEAAK